MDIGAVILQMRRISPREWKWFDQHLVASSSRAGLTPISPDSYPGILSSGPRQDSLSSNTRCWSNWRVDVGRTRVGRRWKMHVSEGKIWGGASTLKLSKTTEWGVMRPHFSFRLPLLPHLAFPSHPWHPSTQPPNYSSHLNKLGPTTSSLSLCAFAHVAPRLPSTAVQVGHCTRVP